MLYPILAGVNLIFNIVKYVFNALSGSGPDGTIFLNKTGDLSDAYYVQITPAGWTFSIWGFIYAWEATWIIYSLINICRKGTKGPAYKPYFIPPVVLILYCLGCLLNITWLITFDRQEIEVACAALIAYSFVFYIMLFLAYRALDRVSPILVNEEQRTVDIWLTRGFLHNALAMQATWVSVATLLNVAMVMTYRADPGVDVTDASTVSLSILSAELVLFAITDLLFLDRYTRYTITPYIVLTVALSGSLSKNYVAGARNSVFTVILLAIVGALLLTKLVLTIYRHFTRPRYTTFNADTIGGSSKGWLA